MNLSPEERDAIYLSLSVRAGLIETGDPLLRAIDATAGQEGQDPGPWDGPDESLNHDRRPDAQDAERKGLTMTQKLFDLRVRINYWVDSSPALSCVVILVPYVFGIIVMTVFHTPVVFIPVMVFAMTLVFIRMFDPLSLGFCYSDQAKDYLSNRWLKRGNNQYVYITPMPDGRITIRCLTLHASRYFPLAEDWDGPWLATYPSYWEEWSFSHVRKVTLAEEEFIQARLKEAKVKQ